MIRGVAIAVLLHGCGPSYSTYIRTSPQQVEVAKHVSAPTLVVAAHSTADTITLIAKRSQAVRITRVVHYGAMAFDLDRGNPLTEILEIPIGVLVLLMPILWEPIQTFEESRAVKGEMYLSYPLALLSPVHTATFNHMNVHPSDRDVFVDPPITRQYRVDLPASAVMLSYRVLDDTEQAIASGSVTTDTFGSATIPNAAGALAIEITTGGHTTVIPLDQETP